MQCVVLCSECGETLPGRVRRVCPAHPRALWLSDLAACPACKITDLEKLKEFCL